MSIFKQRMALLASAGILALTIGGAQAADTIKIGLVTKTDSNPFFAKMKEGAQAKGKELGAEIRSLRRQVRWRQRQSSHGRGNLISSGVAGILITPSDTKAIVPTIEQARKAGILVIALDTPLDPANAADMTFATDNFKAGELIGAWAAKTVKDPASAQSPSSTRSRPSRPSMWRVIRVS